MRILFITQRCGNRSGWETYSTELVHALRAKGNRVDVVSTDSTADFRVSLPDPLRYKLLALVSMPLAFCLWLRLRRKLRQYDLIHCAIEPYAPFTRVLSVIMGRPYILTVHGSYGVKTLDGIFGVLQRSAYTHAARIVCVSTYSQDRLTEHISLKRSIVIPNGVTVPTDVAPSTRQPHLVFTVGAVKPRKGQHLVVEALAKVKERIPDVQYVVAGDLTSHAEYVATLRKRVAELDLGEAVVLAGRIDAQRLRDLYAKGSLFVMTPASSATDFEGFGLVYLEANACGVPVVGMAGSGAIDAIAAGRSGLIAREGDVADLADKITSILLDENLRDRLAVGGLKWAYEHVWSKVIDRYIAVYAEAIGWQIDQRTD